MTEQNKTQLPARAAGELFGLWERVLNSGPAEMPQQELRRIARVLSAEAHDGDIPAERLVVLIKESWASHAGLRAHEDRRAMQLVLTEMVSLCISEFYRD